MEKSKALQESMLNYARMMGRRALLEKMRYHEAKIKEHREEKNETIALIQLLNEVA